MLGWGPKHQVYRRLEHPPGRSCSVGPQDPGRAVVPVTLVLVCEGSKLNSSVKPLDEPVALGVECHCSDLRRPQTLADLRLEIAPLVAVELGGDPKLGEHLFLKLSPHFGLALRTPRATW